MTSNEKDTPLSPPSYTESLNYTHQSQQLLDQLTLVRAQNLRTTIDTQIIPLVTQRATYGIAQTVIALLPSDIPLPALGTDKSEFSFDTTGDGNGNENKKVEVLGFSSDEEPEIARLEGQMNRTEFWRARGIVEELERLLKERLNKRADLGDGGGGGGGSQVGSEVGTAQQQQQQKPKKGFFGRMAGTLRSGERSSSSGNVDTGARLTEESNQVAVSARLEEVTLRTVSEFGLYDTMAKQCVVIRVNARC